MTVVVHVANSPQQFALQLVSVRNVRWLVVLWAERPAHSQLVPPDRDYAIVETAAIGNCNLEELRVSHRARSEFLPPVDSSVRGLSRGQQNPLNSAFFQNLPEKSDQGSLRLRPLSRSLRAWNTMRHPRNRRENLMFKRHKTLGVLAIASLLVVIGVWLAPRLWAQAAALPDLTIDANRLRSSIVFRTQTFKAGDCALTTDDLCVGAAGKRKLMKFDVAIPNIGTADFVLGNPADNPDLFQLSPCHGHYHLKSFASYELLNGAGTIVLRGRKQAFCLEDYTKVSSSAGAAKYTCSNQGISVGWSDVYGSYLDCQWLDVTDIAPGNYQLKVTINATPALSTKLTESNYGNNSATVLVTIKK